MVYAKIEGNLQNWGALRPDPLRKGRVADPVEIRPSSHAEFVRSMSKSTSVIREISLKSLTHRLPLFCDFLLTPSNGPISYRFRDIRQFQSKIANFPTPVYLTPLYRGVTFVQRLDWGRVWLKISSEAWLQAHSTVCFYVLSTYYIVHQYICTNAASKRGYGTSTLKSGGTGTPRTHLPLKLRSPFEGVSLGIGYQRSGSKTRMMGLLGREEVWRHLHLPGYSARTRQTDGRTEETAR